MGSTVHRRYGLLPLGGEIRHNGHNLGCLPAVAAPPVVPAPISTGSVPPWPAALATARIRSSSGSASLRRRLVRTKPVAKAPINGAHALRTFLDSSRTRAAVSLNARPGPSIRGHPPARPLENMDSTRLARLKRLGPAPVPLVTPDEAWLHGSHRGSRPRHRPFAERHCSRVIAASGITTSGRSAMCSNSCETLPSSARKRPSRRAPTTISSARRARATSAIA
jgi:hypothetical protein